MPNNAVHLTHATEFSTMEHVIRDLRSNARQRGQEAIAAGDMAGAAAAIEAVWQESRPIHDLYGDICASLLDYVAQELGEAAIESAWRHVGEQLWRPLLASLASQPIEQALRAMGVFLHSHGYDFECLEHSDRYEFLLNHCPSGGRMLEEGKRAGDPRHPLEFGASTTPHVWSFDQTGVLYYCAHTKLWMDLLPKEWGLPLMSASYGDFDDTGNVIGQPCMITLWKANFPV